MPRITQNLRKRTIGMLNVGTKINAVAMNIECSTRAIRHLRQRFQATGHMEDRPRDARPRPIYSEHSSAQSLPNCLSY